MVLQIIILVIGLTLLIKGADWLVDGASYLAESLGVSPLFIGLTVVAFGTSAPELAVSLSATLKGSGSIAISNVIGSNIANIGLVIGFTAILVPLGIQRSTVRKELPFNILLSFAVMAMLLRGNHYGLDRYDGFILLIFLIIFFEYAFVMAKKDRSEKKKAGTVLTETDTDELKKMRIKNTFLFILGLVMVVVGSNFTVNSASEIALALGVSEAFIGLSMIALGTSLPELVTSLSAVFKKNADIALGNIIGSNIFNICLILGTTSIVSPISVEVAHYWLDILVMSLLAVGLFVFTLKKSKVTRTEGIVFFSTYIAYIVYISFRG